MSRFRSLRSDRHLEEVDADRTRLGEPATPSAGSGQAPLPQAIGRIRSIIYLLPHLWRTLWTRPITVRYPFEPLELPPYFRGRVVIDADLCRGCGACVHDCPAFGLELERVSRDQSFDRTQDRSTGSRRDRFRLLHYPDRCAYCGQCEATCPSEAIKLISEYVPATSRREELVEVLVEVR